MKKPVVIPLLAKHDPRPHRCGACYFYESHCKRSYSKQVAKLAPFIKDPTIVPHVVPNDFDDPEYSYKVMRNTYMINSGRKSQEIFQLKKQLERKDLELQKVQEENINLRHQINGDPPYICGCYEISEADIQAGWEEVKDLLQRYNYDLKHGWSHYNTEPEMFTYQKVEVAV